MTTTYRKDEPETIQEMFGSVAHTYDKGNAILSLQMHRLWNRALINKVIRPSNPEVILDLCCGTGAISFAYLSKEIQSKQAFLLDFCEPMLAVARERAKSLALTQHRLKYICGDAQDVPLPDESVDCVTVAYGIRNVKEPQRCVAEAFRVLRPGGRFGILELTQPRNGVLRWGHRMYLETVLPLVGKVALSDAKAYQYLCRSIQAFIPADELEAMLVGSGFLKTWQKSMMGGVATIISGVKPK